MKRAVLVEPLSFVAALIVGGIAGLDLSWRLGRRLVHHHINRRSTA